MPWAETLGLSWYAMPEVAQLVQVRAVGRIAAAALRASHGRVAALPAFATAPYVLASGEIVWIGAVGPMHPRAVFVAGPYSLDDQFMPEIEAWRPRPASDRGGATPRLLAAMPGLAAALLPALPARGYAPLLAARPLELLLQARRGDALALARAATCNDPKGFVTVATRLLGLGGGLTPSGDDYVGGALFALRQVHANDPGWAAAAATLRALATTRTHAISAALLADLANGESFAPLHELLNAAIADAPARVLAAHARAVAAIGHSSGWDMLTGIFAATGALPGNMVSSN